jgi:hypothetical protein
MANPVVHWEIGGRDLDKMADFYRQLFGWESAGFDPDYRLVELGEGIGGGFMHCRDDMPAYVTVYVAVDDLDATLATVPTSAARNCSRRRRYRVSEPSPCSRTPRATRSASFGPTAAPERSHDEEPGAGSFGPGNNRRCVAIWSRTSERML